MNIIISLEKKLLDVDFVADLKLANYGNRFNKVTLPMQW